MYFLDFRFRLWSLLVIFSRLVQAIFEHCFWLPFFEMFHWFWDLQSSKWKDYRGKTNCCRKSPIFNKLKTLWFLVLFWHRFDIIFHVLSVTDFGMLFGIVFLKFLSIWVQNWAPGFVSFGTLFRYFFDPVPQGCLWRFLGSFWHPLLLHFGISSGSLYSTCRLPQAPPVEQILPFLGLARNTGSVNKKYGRRHAYELAWCS